MTEKPVNALEQLLVLNQISACFDSIVTNVSKSKSLDFGKIIAYEVVEVIEKDEKGKEKPPRLSPLVTYASGAEIELTEEENLIFRPFWNMKTKVDNKKFAFASALFNGMFPD